MSVARLEIAVDAVGVVRNAFRELADERTVLLAHERGMFDGPEDLLFPLGEEFGIAGRREHFLALFAQQAGHLLHAFRLVVADAGEGFLALDALGDGGIGLADAYDLVHFRDREAQALHGPGHIVFVLDEFQCVQGRFVHFQDQGRVGGIRIGLSVAALTYLLPFGKVNLGIRWFAHNGYIMFSSTR